MLPPPLRNLAEILRALPGIGPKQAVRCAFYIFRNTGLREDLLRALRELESVAVCRDCFRAMFKAPDAKNERCAICGDQNRSAALLCVVEDDADIEQFEKTAIYKGKYFVLGGRLSLTHDPRALRVDALKERIARDSSITEIVLALSSTAEGNAAALWLKQSLAQGARDRTLTLTRLGIGMPAGAEIEYADEETLKGALEHRS